MDKTFLTRAPILALLLVCVGAVSALGWFWWSSTGRPDVDSLPGMAPAEWIIYPSGPEGVLHPRIEMSTAFQRSFKLDAVPSRAVLRVAALHRYELSINNNTINLPTQRNGSWKEPDVFEIAPQLSKGSNQIVVTVFNTNGPPALWLSVETPGLMLNSDEGWETSYAGATWKPAWLARKPRVALKGSTLYDGDAPFARVGNQWWVLLVFGALSAASFWFFRRREIDDRWLVSGLALFWVALFANNLSVLPTDLGFDVQGHMDYIRYLQERHRFPLPGDGWEMFQAPLYYSMSAALLGLLSLSVTEHSGLAALRWMGLVIGVAHFVVVWASLRLLFPESKSKQRWGLILAACLPPLLYLSQYVTNEALAGAMVSACAYLTLRLLKKENPSWMSYAGLGLCLGLGLLAKSTALLVVPLSVGALLWKRVESARTRSKGAAAVSLDWRWFGNVSLLLAICVVVCGWHYARLWYHYGSPFLGVWDPRTGFAWWQEDGFRTTPFYLRFGNVFTHPWFGGFTGFWDGIYSTLWGDGLLGGGSGFNSPPPWNFGLMKLGYWLAVLPSVALIAGGALSVVRFVRRPTPEWFLVLGLGFLVGFAMTQMSLVVPYYCMVKAFYGLSGLVPLCALAACGFDFPWQRMGKLRPILWVVFGMWAMSTFASFWVLRSSNPVLLWKVRTAYEEKNLPEAIRLLMDRLELDPHDSTMRSALAELTATGDREEALKLARLAVSDHPEDISAQLVLGRVLAQDGRFAEATEHVRRVVELAPGNALAYEDLATLLVKQKAYDQVIAIAREGLSQSAFSPELRVALARGLSGRGENSEARAQLQLAIALKPEWAEPYYLLGTLSATEGKPDDAISYFAEAVRLEPNFPEALNALASAYARVGKVEAATATARKARESALAAGKKDAAEKAEALIESLSNGAPATKPPTP